MVPAVALTSPCCPAATAQLDRHYDWLMYVFLVWAAGDTTATDAAFMNWLSYGELLLRAGVTDEASRSVNQVQ